MQTQPLQADAPSPVHSQPEAEELVRKAVAAYVMNQNPQTLERIEKAVDELACYDLVRTEKQTPYVYPSMKFALDLLPKHLLDPNPFWDDSLFD